MQRRVTKYGLSAAAIVSLITLSACSSSPGSTSSDGTVTITLVDDSSPQNQIAEKKLISLYEASQSKIKVKFEPANGANAEQGAIVRLGQGDPTLDIAQDEVGYQFQWYKDGWITPLTPYFTKSDLAKVDSHLVKGWTTSDGQFLGIPMDNSTMWLAVNQDLLKQAGVTPPPTMKRGGLASTTSGVWTWEQVLAAAARVHAKTGKTGLLFPADETWVLQPMGQQLGGRVTSPDGLKVKGYLDQSPWVKLATKWKSFFANDVSQITNPTWTNDQFIAGDSAFALSHLGAFALCKQAKFDCDAAAEPYFQGGKKVVQSTDLGWVVNSKSQHIKEAADFLKFTLLNDGAQEALVKNDFSAGMPMLQKDLDAMKTNPAYQTFPGSIKLLGAWQFQNWPEDPTVSPAGATIFTSISDAYKDVRVGAATPEQAVQKMTSQVERALVRYRK